MMGANLVSLVVSAAAVVVRAAGPAEVMGVNPITPLFLLKMYFLAPGCVS